MSSNGQMGSEGDYIIPRKQRAKKPPAPKKVKEQKPEVTMKATPDGIDARYSAATREWFNPDKRYLFAILGDYIYVVESTKADGYAVSDGGRFRPKGMTRKAQERILGPDLADQVKVPVDHWVAPTEVNGVIVTPACRSSLPVLKVVPEDPIKMLMESDLSESEKLQKIQELYRQGQIVVVQTDSHPTSNTAA